MLWSSCMPKVGRNSTPVPRQTGKNPRHGKIWSTSYTDGIHPAILPPLWPGLALLGCVSSVWVALHTQAGTNHACLALFRGWSSFAFVSMSRMIASITTKTWHACGACTTAMDVFDLIPQPFGPRPSATSKTWVQATRGDAPRFSRLTIGPHQCRSTCATFNRSTTGRVPSCISWSCAGCMFLLHSTSRLLLSGRT
jgi:hypothetical protein